VNNISLCEIQAIEPGLSVSSRGMLVGDRLEVVARRACRSPSPPEDTSLSLSRPQLELGDRVVWISDYGPELGTVRWIGILPDSRIKEYTIGVEFVSECCSKQTSFVCIAYNSWTRGVWKFKTEVSSAVN